MRITLMQQRRNKDVDSSATRRQKSGNKGIPNMQQGGNIPVVPPCDTTGYMGITEM